MARITRAVPAFVTWVAFALSASPLRAQAILETPSARIELIGLHRWTLRMVEDSLAVYSPKDALTGHACAAILRSKLHFADASVNVFMNFPNMKTKQYVAITVVEPQDSSRIHYKPFKYDSLPARAEWAAAFATMKTPEVTQRAVQSAAFFAQTMPGDDSIRFAPAAALRDVVLRHRGAADLAAARQTLATDPAHANRVIAAIILGSFPDHDEAWWALVDAVRDPVGMVSATSSQVLGMMTRSAPRAVDWTPMATSLRYILDGTNLFGFDQTARTLAATSVTPSLAKALLADGGDIVRAKLRSAAPDVRDGVAALLAELSGLPASSDAIAFERWMASLGAAPPHRIR
jgi:hypothetical protein